MHGSIAAARRVALPDAGRGDRRGHPDVRFIT